MTARRLIITAAGPLVGLFLLVKLAGGADSQPPQTQPSTPSTTKPDNDEKVLFSKPPDGVTKVTFVCDASGSMLGKFSTLRRELNSTIQAMPASESFGIIFMASDQCRALSPHLMSATPEAKLSAINFLEDMGGQSGETNPIPAIECAFKQMPQLIYLLTDGDFPDNAALVQKIRELNKEHKVKINTIAFLDEGDTDTAFLEVLKTIASENGGVFNRVDESKL